MKNGLSRFALYLDGATREGARLQRRLNLFISFASATAIVGGISTSVSLFVWELLKQRDASINYAIASTALLVFQITIGFWAVNRMSRCDRVLVAQTRRFQMRVLIVQCLLYGAAVWCCDTEYDSLVEFGTVLLMLANLGVAAKFSGLMEERYSRLRESSRATDCYDIRN